ncbi:glycosyltransferase [Candidatus Omnitrophota bacterium]
MLFSVVIPTYNRKQFLKLAADSVLNQNFEDFELIIVDDGSDDGTKDLIQSYSDPRLSYLYQQQKGPAGARNSGIKAARADWICFLDSDDRFRREKLATTREYIEKYPDYRIFHTEELWYRNAGYLDQKKEHKKPEGDVFEKALALCCLSPSAACVHKDVFAKAGLFDEDFPACEDYEFWLRVSIDFSVKLIPDYLTIKQGGHAGQQSDRPGLDRLRFLAIYKTIKNSRLSRPRLTQALASLEEKAAIYIKGAEKRDKTAEAEEIENKLQEIKKDYGSKPLS